MTNLQAVADYGLNVEAYPNPTHARRIRDAATRLLEQITFDTAPIASVRTVPVATVQASQMPALGVFIISYRERQDGDKPASYPQFIATLELGISMSCMAGSDDLLDSAIDTWINAAKQALFCSSEFMQMFEFVLGTSDERVFQRDAQSYVGVSNIRLSLQYRTAYPPFAPYDLRLIDIKVVEPDGTQRDELQITVPETILNNPNLR